MLYIHGRRDKGRLCNTWTIAGPLPVGLDKKSSLYIGNFRRFMDDGSIHLPALGLQVIGDKGSDWVVPRSASTFLDQQDIQATEHMTLALNKMKKHDKPVLVSDRPWEGATSES